MWTGGGKKLQVRRNREPEPDRERVIDEDMANLVEEEANVGLEGANVDEGRVANVDEERVAGVHEERVGDVDEEEVADVEKFPEESDKDEGIEGDDCEVIVEDAAGYRETEPALVENPELDNEPELVNVEICDDDEWSAHFGDVAHEDGNGDPDDSGDDMWDDDHIPNPLSDDDEEENAEGRPFTYGPKDILALGKTFNNAEEFKYALLCYSLETEYNIEMYKSSQNRLGAKCTKAKEEKCSWRVFCSFEKSKNKLMIKVFENHHVCVRSGSTKLLKSGTIAQLFQERLRVNPKIKSQFMVDEIKRELHMIVSVHQCRRAKSSLAAKRKASHEAHFARLRDYQAEVLRSNKDSIMEIETIPGPVPGSKQRFYRLYVCFEALKSSWKESCRPIIGLDAAFMKWDIKGQMLGAVEGSLSALCFVL